MNHSWGSSRAWLWASARAALAAIILCPQVFAQTSWSREQFTSENGLLQNRVHAMERDPWGGLLVGTEGGLVRFDGENFQQVGIAAPEGLLPSRVLEIIPVPGKAYVIRDAGSRQYLYRNNELTPITADAPARKPSSRFAGQGVSVAVAVRAMDPDSTMPGKDSWPYGVRMIPLGGGKWCLRTDRDLLVYDNDSLVDRFAIPAGKWSHLLMLNGHLYAFGTDGNAYMVDVASHQSRKVHTEGFPFPELKEGHLTWRLHWEAGEQQISLIATEGLFVVHSADNGEDLVAEHLPLEMPTDCKVGSVIWLNKGEVLAVGTDIKGLFVYRRNSMRTLLCEVVSDGVNNAYFAQAPFGRDGVISSTRGLSRVFTSAGCLPGQPPIPGFDESAIILDKDQRYWYGREDTLFQYDAISGEEQKLQTGLRPLCFLEQGNSMLIGTPKGIYQVSGNKFTLTNPMDEGDLSMRPSAMCELPDGNLWVATCSGVYRAKANGGWEPVPGLSGVCARTLAVVDQLVYIGTYGSGAYMYKEGRLYRLPSDNEGFLSHVHAFMADRIGYLWMSTNQGLFRVRRTDLDQWTRDTTQSVYMAYYGKRSGIRNSEFNGGCSPAFTRTLDGWASFPTMDGLVWFRPEELPDDYPVDSILLRDVTVDGKKLAMAGNIPLAWDHREVVVRFSLAYWGANENARLEYFLDGKQGGQWTGMGAGQRELRLSTLHSGETVLRIRKVGAAFRGGPEVLTLRFSVPIPFYRASWFIAICMVAGGGLLWLILRINAARLRRRNLQLEKMVRLRTGELVDANSVLRRSLEMKEMLVSIISHDIVTPLRFIARVSNGVANGARSGDPGRLNDTLQDIARSSDKLHTNAQGLLQWIKRQDGRIDLRIRSLAVQPFVGEVLAMERERATDKGVRLVNNISLDDVVQTDRNVLSIVLHNLVANAVTHTAKGEVIVAGGVLQEGYRITVADTGSGMPDAALRHAQRVQGKGALGAMNEDGERDVQGLGLLIVADLLQLLGGTFTMESAQGKGTTVTLLFTHESDLAEVAGQRIKTKERQFP